MKKKKLKKMLKTLVRYVEQQDEKIGEVAIKVDSALGTAKRVESWNEPRDKQIQDLNKRIKELEGENIEVDKNARNILQEVGRVRDRVIGLEQGLMETVSQLRRLMDQAVRVTETKGMRIDADNSAGSPFDPRRRSVNAEMLKDRPMEGVEKMHDYNLLLREQAYEIAKVISTNEFTLPVEDETHISYSVKDGWMVMGQFSGKEPKWACIIPVADDSDGIYRAQVDHRGIEYGPRFYPEEDKLIVIEGLMNKWGK